MTDPKAESVPLSVQLEAGSQTFAALIVEAKAFSLWVQFSPSPPSEALAFSACELVLPTDRKALGACRFEPHPDRPLRRVADPPAPVGDGVLIFLDGAYDFSELMQHERVVDVRQKLSQLPLVLGRKTGVRPEFREFCMDLLFELSVRRSLFDKVDRQLAQDSSIAQSHVRQLIFAAEYPKFAKFLDAQVKVHQRLVAGFSRSEHEQHGFYFRKQLWDMLMRSALLQRTNLKPRGYAGDSEMMEMIYANSPQGETLFEQFLHKYSVALGAAQAVRNRRSLIRQEIQALRAMYPPEAPFRLLSLACGPARELQDLLTDPAAREAYRLTLLDQDSEALAQAQAGLEALQPLLGGPAQARFVRQSVRTLLRSADLQQTLGSHDVIYAMGLFDYLAQPVARALLASLYPLLAPGGVLLIGNYHRDHGDRVFMDYWADWVLLYRSEADMLALAENLPNAEARVIFEDTGCQMFLHITKAP